MNALIQRPCTPLESLTQACKEMKLIHEGNLQPKRNWRTMFAELEKEYDEYENSIDGEFNEIKSNGTDALKV